MSWHLDLFPGLFTEDDDSGGGGGGTCANSPELLCLGGRAGAANNPLLSLDDDGTITGSADPTKGLHLLSAPLASAAVGGPGVSAGSVLVEAQAGGDGDLGGGIGGVVVLRAGDGGTALSGDTDGGAGGPLILSAGTGGASSGTGTAGDDGRAIVFGRSLDVQGISGVPQLRLFSIGPFATAFKAQPQTGNIVYTLPAALPTDDFQALHADTFGALDWLDRTQVRTDGTDTNPGFLTDKIVAGTGVTLAVVAEQLEISATGGGGITNPLASGTDGTLWGSDTTGKNLILVPNNADATGKVAIFSEPEVAFDHNSFGEPRLLVGGNVDPSSLFGLGISAIAGLSQDLSGATFMAGPFFGAFGASDDNQGSQFFGAKSRGNLMAPTPVLDHDILFQFSSQGVAPSGGVALKTPATFIFSVDGTPSGDVVPGVIGVRLTDELGNNPVYFRWDREGRVGIGDNLYPFTSANPADRAKALVHIRAVSSANLDTSGTPSALFSEPTTIIQATTGQATNLTEWWNAAGGVVGNMDPAGNLHIVGKLTVDGIIDPTQVAITNGVATPPLVVQHAVNVPNLDADLLDGRHAAAFGQIVDVVSAANQGAAIASTNFPHATTPGLYAIHYTLRCSTADALAVGTVLVTFAWNDGAGARSVSSAAIVVTALTGWASGTVGLVRLGSGSLSYATTLSASLGTAKYALDAVLVKVG